MSDVVAKLVKDAVTYPILTKEVGRYGGGTDGDGSRSGAGGALTHTAQTAIRDLLGWRYRKDDPKGFVAALQKAVQLKEVDGHVEAEWNARPFMVQADLGEVTGAQASIYERAKVAIDHALPLLDSLQPLKSYADPEGVETMRGIVRSSLTEIVLELAQVGGPRIHKIDGYFERLLGPLGAAEYDGALRTLRIRFGFSTTEILTIPDERHFTNFLILVDYAKSLRNTWEEQKPNLTRSDTGEKFLGTELVRLAKALNVVVESVHEAYDAMDSVFFGAHERAVVEIETGGAPITVAELLAWVEHFASVEAPQLVENCGRDGVDAVAFTLDELKDLVHHAVEQSEGEPVPPAGL